MEMDEILRAIAINAIPFIFAITMHEAAHGYIAGRLGDPTARMMGRITLNPLPHIDPFGTVLLPMLMLALPGSMLFGWARPVPVNFSNLRRPRRDTMLVAFAGPGSNFLQFCVWAAVILLIRFSVGLPAGLDISDSAPMSRITVPILLMALAGLKWNFWLGVFNLIPILPLDGGRIFTSMLPEDLAHVYAKTERYGFFVLLFILYFLGSYLAFLTVPLRWAVERLLF